MTPVEAWPWWLGMVGMAGASLGYCYFFGRMLGVSGSFTRVLGAREEAKVAREEAKMRTAGFQLDEAMLQATLEQFGPEAVAQLRAEAQASCAPAASTSVESSRQPWTVHATFLSTLVLGGLVGATLKGGARLSTELNATFARVWASGPQGFLVLVLAGLLVGFGTRMSGGCTSGHGLSGVGCLKPSSMVATGCFLGVAIAVTLLFGGGA